MPASVDLACEALGLDLLPPSLPFLAFGTLASFGIQTFSRLCSPSLFPRTYPSLSKPTQLNWDAHVVAWAHSFYAVAAAAWMLLDGDRFGVLGQDKVFGYERTAASAILCCPKLED